MAKEWGSTTTVKKLNPTLLGQANIPKPLHGINPRTIMGASAWSKHRQIIIQNNPYCVACGLENCTLDLHEDYKIDYINSKMSVQSYVPLCKRCHNFIHSGFLRLQLQQGILTLETVINTLKHGILLCSQNNISIFVGTELLAKELRVPLLGVRSWTPKMSRDWASWILEYEGKEYRGMSCEAWKNKYRNI